jgi:hypothetical protein
VQLRFPRRGCTLARSVRAQPHQRPRRAAARVALVLLACAGLASAEGGTPVAAYEKLVAVTRKAKSWQPILPLLSAQYRSDVESQDAEGQKAFLRYFKSSLDHRGLVVTLETSDGDTAVLAATARDAAGKPASGRIEMVREGGAWRLHDFGWATAQ